MALSVANETTDGNGVTSWDATSVYNGPGTSTLRIKAPDSPDTSKPHRFLHVLPVKPDLSVEFGDGLEELRVLGAQDTSHCTLVAITTPTEPWLGDNPSNPDHRYESYLVLDVIPWLEANHAVTGTEEHWLLSFSKGGYSALHLFFRNRAIFSQAAAWDTPYHIPWTIGPGWEMDEAYGSEANWTAAYKLDALLSTWATGSILTYAQLWISGDNAVYTADVNDMTADMLSFGIRHWWNTGSTRAHAWTSGWLPNALAALENAYQGRHQSPGIFPAIDTTLDTNHSLAQNLEFSLFFHQGQGSHLWNKGLGSLAPGLLSTAMAYADGPDGPILEQSSGLGADFGTTFTGLDTSDKTICAWVRPDILTPSQALLAKEFDNTGGDDGGWSALIDDNGRPQWHADANKDLSDDGTTLLQLSTWVMIAYAWDVSAATVDFYIDGVLNSTHTDETIVETSSGTAILSLGIGRLQVGGIHPYTGAFSQIRAYSRTLQEAEIAALASDPFAGFVTQGSSGGLLGITTLTDIEGIVQ